MEEEKLLYVGCKIIKAVPGNNNEGEPGYIVTYPDGYTSWSPKDVFENAYRLITDGEKEMMS